MAIKELDKVLSVNDIEIPEELKQVDHWLLWRAELDDKRQEYKKVPYQVNGNYAKSNDSKTWNEFNTIFNEYENNNYEGIGFILEESTNYIVLDIDNAVDPDTHQLQTDLAIEMTELTYCELSPSGTGLHCFFKGKLPEERKKKRKDLDIELYDTGRFMTVTGYPIGQSEICDEQAIIENIVERYFKAESKPITTYEPNHKSDVSDEDVINLMLKSKQKEKISDLLKGDYEKYFGSPSEAVQSLLHYLAFYTGKDRQQMERIFLSYNNLTDKWDEKRGDTTWGNLELDRAISNQNDVYQDITNKFKIKFDEDKIPDGFKIGDNGWLYKIVEETVGTYKEKRTIEKPVLITSTPPVISCKFRDVESGDFRYQLNFNQGNNAYKLQVEAKDITDGQYMIALASKGFDVNSINRQDLIRYIGMYMRINNKPIMNVATRLGDVNGHFISPYKEDNEKNKYKLFNVDNGYQILIDAFKTKGNIEDYIEGVFKPIRDKPMVMMMFYSSLASVLVKDFDVDPFVSEISGRTSSGKTFTLNICASVWGSRKLVTEWHATDNSFERISSFLNSFPVIKDDTRKANNISKIPGIIYQFSGGQSKGRANSNRSIDAVETWNNIMLSSGEVSIPDMASDKGGVAGRVITLQEDPFPNEDIDIFSKIAIAMKNNHGLLGKEFIKQYQENKEKYLNSYESAVKYFIKKAEGNEVMDRIARSFALLQVAGEILNDIEGFEHDPYLITNRAHHSMMKHNQNIDKPKQRLEEVLEKLNANRGRIGYQKSYHDSAELMGIYKSDFMLVMAPTIKDILGTELNSTIKQWCERGYLETDKTGMQKQIKFYSEKQKGYAIKTGIINELGFDFAKHNSTYGYPYST